MDGKTKTYLELRQEKYESILDEVMFVARASEGAVSVEWLMDQPIQIRRKYVEQFDKELKERIKNLNSK